eukprot:TRINITY_DN4517_c0_g1_i5.p1 TRINITY_DN4517_c0_g1~~TRINITY_DN4517_c0_g1_i5.p1  ORF type:complete len:242 (+),score=38.32 TRINITY_DN4517_c0_g1_i5:157-882(+)
MEVEAEASYELISQGAEARVYKTFFLGGPCIVKERFEKKYRNPALDEKLTRERILSEVRNMSKLRKQGINTPYILFVDMSERKIYMQYVESSFKLRDLIYKMEGRTKLITKVLNELGRYLALMHDNGCIHGDLTTSNILVKAKDLITFGEEPKNDIDTLFPVGSEEISSLYLIDFGLSYVSSNVEDRAVDLYVLERAFLSTHPNTEKEFALILSSYAKTSPKASETMTRLEKGILCSNSIA